MFSGNGALMFVTLSNFASSIVTVVSGLIVVRWLLPEQLGEFSSFTILTSYIILSQIGIPSGLSRELPFYLGKNETDKALSFVSTAKAFLFFVSLVIFSICCVVSIYFCVKYNFSHAAGALVVGAISFQGIYITKFLKVLYRTDDHFVRLARIKLILSIMSLLTLVLVYNYLFYGLCLRAIILVLVDWYFTNRWRPISANAHFDWEHFKVLFRVGGPIYSVSSIYGLWPTVQRTFVLTELGTRGLGIYALAGIVQVMLNTINNAISSMSFPQMSRAFGEGRTIKYIMSIPLKPLLISLMVYSVIMAVGWPLLPVLVERLLQNYVEGISAAQWMFAVALVSSFGVFSNIYLVLKRNHHRLVGYIMGVIVWFAYIYFHSIEGMEDLVVFSQAVFAATVCISISDMLFYISYLRRA